MNLLTEQNKRTGNLGFYALQGDTKALELLMNGLTICSHDNLLKSLSENNLLTKVGEDDLMVFLNGTVADFIKSYDNFMLDKVDMFQDESLSMPISSASTETKTSHL